MNQCILTGTVATQPAIRYTDTGKTFCILTIAVDSSGQLQDSQEVDVLCWDKKAEFVGKYLSVGRRVAVTAKARSRTVSASGTSFRSTEIVANDFEFLDNRNA